MRAKAPCKTAGRKAGEKFGVKNCRTHRVAGAGILIAALACWPLAPSRAGQSVKPTVDVSIYRRAIHVGWVVKDLDRVLDYWEKLGLRNIQRAGLGEVPDRTYRGRPSHLSRKTAIGRIGDVEIEWIQPVNGESAAHEFLRRHGDGVHHLAFAVHSEKQFLEQVEHFKELGVGVIEEGSWQGATGRGRMAYLDTAPQGGGLALELVYNPDPATADASAQRNEEPFNKIVQYALVVRDVKKVNEFWEGLGFGRMPVDHNVSVDRNYRGQPGKFEMYLGWWHWPDVTFEWIQSLVGPSVYDEYLRAHGEGFHHLAFQVADFDQAVQALESRGAPVSQSGGWKSPGSEGRFAYFDAEPYGGVTIELLWDKPQKK